MGINLFLFPLQGDDVPEEQLPHPFNQTKPTIISNVSRCLSTSPPIISSPSNAHSQQEFAVPSHVSRSFQRRFSQKIPILDGDKTPLTCYNNAAPKDESLASVAPSPMQCTSKPPLRRKSFLGCPIISLSLSIKTQEEESRIAIKPDSISRNELNALEGTPAKLISTPARLMSATPEIQTPKRSCPPMDCDTTPLKKSAKRSFSFNTPNKDTKKFDEETEAGSLPVVDDVIGFLPESLLQSVQLFAIIVQPIEIPFDVY